MIFVYLIQLANNVIKGCLFGRLKVNVELDIIPNSLWPARLKHAHTYIYIYIYIYIYTYNTIQHNIYQTFWRPIKS